MGIPTPCTGPCFWLYIEKSKNSALFYRDDSATGENPYLFMHQICIKLIVTKDADMHLTWISLEEQADHERVVPDKNQWVH